MHFKKVKSLLSAGNNMNLYRGCTHGCIYCDSRSDCYQMDHDFEDIEVKINAPELLSEALGRKKRACMIGTGAMCDPYMPCEKELELTRRCLEIIKRYGFGVSVLTKSSLILRDKELLAEINHGFKTVVNITITTANDKLCRIVEPNVAVTSERFGVLKEFQALGVPTVVWLTPILPFINDTAENIREIVERCADCGVKGIITFGAMGVTLRQGDREYFYKCLDLHFPGLKERYSKTYGLSYEVPSPNSKELLGVFKKLCGKYGIMSSTDEIMGYLRSADEVTGEQMSFF